MAQQPAFFAELQTKLSAEKSSWNATDTDFAKLPVSEKRLFLGAEPPPGEAGLQEREQRAKASYEAATPRAAPGLPAAIDWRSRDGKNYVTDVKNQKNCGSCVAFGTNAAVESAFRIKKQDANLSIDMSEAHLFYCHGAAEGRTCSNGWWPSKALEAFRKTGVVDEACFPYTPGDQACNPCGDWQSRLTKLNSWQSLTSPQEMKKQLSEKGPLIGCFVVYEDFYAYESGIYRHVHGERLGGHCVCIVGYNDSESCWIAKNSWGGEWGDNGFFKIAYGEVGIDYEMWSVDVAISGQEEGWLQKKTITGVWVIDEGRHAAAYIDGVGWKKIPSEDVSVFTSMVAALSSAKSAKSPCNIRVSGDFIKELYVF